MWSIRTLQVIPKRVAKALLARLPRPAGHKQRARQDEGGGHADDDLASLAS